MSNCELGDMSIAPFVNALQEHKTFAILDISHNLLGTNILFNLFIIYFIKFVIRMQVVIYRPLM